MRQVIGFNTKWGFSKEATAVPAEMPQNWYWVNLPHTWNAIDGQDGNNDYYRGTVYYANTLKKMNLPEADRYYVEILAAASSGTLYVNGKEMAHHDGGFSTWRVDITDELQEDNLIVIACDNAPNNTVYPQMADFTFYGGLYRGVNIVAVSQSHFDLDYYGGPGIAVTPEIEDKDAVVKVDVYLTNAKEGQNLVYTLKDKEGNVVAADKTDISETSVSFRIKNVHLWHGRKDPYLYSAEVLLVEGQNVLDNVSTRFGCRTFRVDPKNGFILNGEEYPLRGVTRHQDRWGIGNALLPEHHEEDVALIMEVGATTIRLAHYQHAQYFYDLCDENGLVIWAEIPYISKHMPTGRKNTISQMKELITQNYNHASICVWGLSNEITISGSDEDLLENHKILNDICHTMDPTRLTTIAAVSMTDMDDPYLQVPDLVSYNHYFGWYGGETDMNGPWFDEWHKKFPNIPIGMSEYGAEALNWHTSNPTQGDYTEEYQAYYHEELIKQLFPRKFIWATHLWNMYDFGCDGRDEGGESGQNHKGLVTIDRKYKKDAFYAYKAWLSDEPFVHICGKRYVDRVEDVTKVTVYSNQPEVEMFVNGESIGKLTAEDHFFYFNVPNKGESTLIAVAGEQKDESFIRKVDTFNESYRFHDSNSVINWFDITEVEGCYSINDKMSDIMKSPEAMQLFAGMFAKMQSQSVAGGFEMNENMMKMLGSFTFLRLTSMLGMAGEQYVMTKEQILGINAALNKIKKAD